MNGGFPVVSGLSKLYLNNIYDETVRNYVLTVLSGFTKINIIKFIEFTEEEIKEEGREIFNNDKETLMKLADSK